jgi:hypothetical protein
MAVGMLKFLPGKSLRKKNWGNSPSGRAPTMLMGIKGEAPPPVEVNVSYIVLMTFKITVFVSQIKISRISSKQQKA